jgi:hypothetical protein
MREPAELSKQTDFTLGDVIVMMTVLLETATDLKDSLECKFITVEEAQTFLGLLVAPDAAIGAQAIDYSMAKNEAGEAVLKYLAKHTSSKQVHA